MDGLNPWSLWTIRGGTFVRVNFCSCRCWKKTDMPLVCAWWGLAAFQAFAAVGYLTPLLEDSTTAPVTRRIPVTRTTATVVPWAPAVFSFS
jgi:hypothetical protein